MSDSTVIRNARLLQKPGLYQISIEAGVVEQVTPMTEVPAIERPATESPASQSIDVEGDWLSLGAIDLQINGALGLAFPDLRSGNLEKLQSICEFLWQQGMDGFCPTLVTTSLENFQGSLAAIAAFQTQQQQNGPSHSAKVLGAHLEGPFLNPAKRGAHPAEYLQPLTLENVKQVIGEYAHAVKIVTLAPELEAEAGVISWLTHQGITVSLGHSLATAEQAGKAFAHGASMVTHAFNAMPGLHHRDPGLLGEALTNPLVFCGFIADAQHICPTMLSLLLRAGRGSKESFLGGLFLVSDALSPLGLPDGKYPWDSRQIEVVNGTARLADGTLSGTTLPLIEGALNLVEWGLCEVEEAIALVTQSPRKAIFTTDSMLNRPANLLRWHQDDEGLLKWQRLSC